MRTKKKTKTPTAKAASKGRAVVWQHFLATEATMHKAVKAAQSPDAKIAIAARWAREWLWTLTVDADYLRQALEAVCEKARKVPGPGSATISHSVEDAIECLERFVEEGFGIVDALPESNA